MTQTFIPQQEEIQAMQMQQIIFDDSDLVSLKVAARIDGHMRQICLLLTFRQFNDLLRFTGQIGEALQGSE